MAIFDIFKKTKKEESEVKKTPKKKTSKLTSKKEKPEEKKQTLDEALQPQKEKPVAGAKKVEKKQFSEAWRILESPHVTEKSTRLAEQAAYIFKVKPSANKPEIRQAIQDLYGVKVEKVNIVNIPRKTRRVGRNEGYKPGYKKAIVKLAAGEKIEIMPR